MGTFDVNQSARNFATTANANHQQATHRFQVHNRQYQERVRNLTSRPGRMMDPSVNPEFPDDDYPQLEAVRRPRRLMWVLLIVVVLAIAGVVLMSGDDVRLPLVSSGINGTVRDGTAWNVRGGPGMDFPPIATVQPGQAVVVTCMAQGWARLDSPNQEAFVYSEALALDSAPPPC